MKKNILTALLLIFIFTVHKTFAEEYPNKTGDFTVKLPDGLYLYQPKIKKEPFSPLFIIDKGKLVDPYALRDRIGIERFDKEYVNGKRFNVYTGDELIGTMSGVILLLSNPENMKEYSSDIIGYGTYSGGPLPGEVSDGSLYADDFNTDFGTIKTVLTPEAFKDSKERARFKATKEDAKRATDAVRKRYGLYAKGIIANVLAKEKQQILGESRSTLDFVTAVDLNGNGKKELIGTYSFAYDHKARSVDNIIALSSLDMLFIMWDSGKVEKISVGTESFPAYSLGGIIDLDGDGVYELIVQESIAFKYEYNPDIDYEGFSPDGKRIVIFKYSHSGWKKVFCTITVTDRIN